MADPNHPRGIPDLARAHGAWVYLFACVAAGALVGERHGVEPPLLVGTGFAGAFLTFAGLSYGLRRRRRQVLVGCALAIGAPLLALWIGAEAEFVFVGLLALFAAASALRAARTLGFLARPTIALGIATLTLTAPAVALAGGASGGSAALLFLLLYALFCWRSFLVARFVTQSHAPAREELRARGLREAGLAAVWTIAVTLVV